MLCTIFHVFVSVDCFSDIFGCSGGADMAQFLLFAGVVTVICILMNRIAEKIPVPSLIFFLLLGMCFGVDGISYSV